MKKLIIMLSFTQLLFAKVDWYGYFENENDYAVLPKNNLYFGYNKLRVDFTAAPSNHVRVCANLITKFYHGQNEWNLMDYIHPSYHPVIPFLDNEENVFMDTLQTYPYAMKDTTFLDNAFVHIRTKRLDVTIGKQQISPGVGYAWNPTDIFNHKDIMDPTYEQTGINALRLSIPMASKATVDLILQPNHDWEATQQQYQFKFGLKRFDISLIYAHTQFNKTGLSNSLSSARDLYGLSFEGELIGLGVRSEVAANRIPALPGEWHFEYILGMDYTFQSGLYLLSEYYHNDLGARKNEVNFDEYMTVFLGERKSLNRDYLFVMGMAPILDVLDFQLYTIFNITDNSLVINPEFIYRMFEDFELTLTGNIFAGKERSEFGYQDYACRLRFRAYF